MGEELGAELHALLGGALSEAECALVLAPDATRPLVTEIVRALREGRAGVVPEADQAAFEAVDGATREVLLALPDPPASGAGRPEEDTDADAAGVEALRRQVAELEGALARTREQLGQAQHRRDRMKLSEPVAAKEIASLAAYEQSLRCSIAAELEACSAAELECVDATSRLDAAVADLASRLEPDGPFLLPRPKLEELSDANAQFLEAVQAQIDGGAGGGEGGVSGMRGVAMQELQRLQDLFVNTELDRTDALQMKDEALAIQTVAQEQLAQLASGADVRAQQPSRDGGHASVEEQVVAKRNDITSLTKHAERLRKESEAELLVKLKGSQALPIKEGDYVLRMAEKEAELERVREAANALQEHKLRMQVFETFVADELMGHRQRASAMGASLAQLNEVAQSAPLAADGAARSGVPSGVAPGDAEREADEREALRLLEHLLIHGGASDHELAHVKALPTASSTDSERAAGSSDSGAAATAVHLAQLVESNLGGARNRRASEREDLVRALLALERRRSGQMRQCRDLLWCHAGPAVGKGEGGGGEREG